MPKKNAYQGARWFKVFGKVPDVLAAVLVVASLLVVGRDGLRRQEPSRTDQIHSVFADAMVARAATPEVRMASFSPASSPDFPRAQSSDPAQLGFVALSSPVRICDTRGSENDVSVAGTSFQCTNSGQPLEAGSNLLVDLPAQLVPPAAQAVVVNVTAVDPSSAGYLTVYPANEGLPSTSSLNMGPGETVANQVTVAIDSAALNVYYGSAPGAFVAVIVDLEGYYLPPSQATGDPYEAVSPVRIADTRCSELPQPSFCEAENLPLANASLGPAGPDEALEVQVAGLDGIPSTTTAVVLNVTATDSTAGSYLSVYPAGDPRPIVSNQNWTQGQTVASQVLVAVGVGSSVMVYNAFGAVDFIVDIEGYFSPPGANGSWFTPEPDPIRLVDTRCGGSTPPSFCSSEDLPARNADLGALDGGSSSVAWSDAPSSSVAVALNVTDVDPTSANYLTVYPAGGTPPASSSLNWSSSDLSDSIANFDYAELGSGGYLSVYDGQPPWAQADLVLDLYGYFAPTMVPPLAVTTTALASGGVGVPYSATLSATGGTPPYTWSLVSGSLPPGLSLSSAGEISGTPSAAGSYSFTVQVTDSSTPTLQIATAVQDVSVSPPPWQQSTNWSGYVVPSNTLIGEVSGQWTVPMLDCAATPNSGVGLWVGIGGVTWPTGGSSGALLQTGVDANCVGGVQEDTAWWELYPSNPNHSVVFEGMLVAPGDLIEASVFEAQDGQWETRVDDLTTGISGVMVTGEGWGVYQDGSGGSFAEQGSTVGLSYAGGYSAEWIAEDYRLGSEGTLVTLADYGTVTFTNMTTSLNSWFLAQDYGYEMVQGGEVLSMPSVPSQDGFSVSYTG